MVLPVSFPSAKVENIKRSFSFTWAKSSLSYLRVKLSGVYAGLFNLNSPPSLFPWNICSKPGLPIGFHSWEGSQQSRWRSCLSSFTHLGPCHFGYRSPIFLNCRLTRIDLFGIIGPLGSPGRCFIGRTGLEIWVFLRLYCPLPPGLLWSSRSFASDLFRRNLVVAHGLKLWDRFQSGLALKLGVPPGASFLGDPRFPAAFEAPGCFWWWTSSGLSSLSFKETSLSLSSSFRPPKISLLENITDIRTSASFSRHTNRGLI